MAIHWLKKSRALICASAAISAALVVLALPAFAGATDGPSTWVIDANTLTTNNIQEDGWFSDGDEPYVGVIQFRSKFGEKGSTQASFLGNLRELSSGADDGDVLPIRDAMGRATFPNVTRLSAQDMFFGTNPEFIGTVAVVMESDSTPWGLMNTGFKEAAKKTKSLIADLVETTTISDIISNPVAFQKKAADVAAKAQKQAKLSVWENIGLTLASFTDPDDRIGAKTTMFLGVDENMLDPAAVNLLKLLAPDRAADIDRIKNLSATLDAEMQAQVGDQGVAGALHPRNFNMEFKGDDARYTVSFSVARG